MIEIFDNIRKIYQFKTPCEELADYIEFFSESSLEATKADFGNARFSVKMFPSWTPTMWINLGSPYYLTTGNNRHLIPAQKDILIVRDTIVERHNLPADHIFSIKFFPGGLEAILGIDQSKMCGQVIDLRSILPVSLLRQINQTNGFEDRTRLLEHFLLIQFHKKKKRDYYMQFIKEMISCYEAGEMRFNVTEMSARLFTTSKTINRYFHRVIGTSPKNYFFILRARTALTAYLTYKQSFNPEDFGYYDMSHFYKDVAKFTGERLKQNKK